MVEVGEIAIRTGKIAVQAGRIASQAAEVIRLRGMHQLGCGGPVAR